MKKYGMLVLTMAFMFSLVGNAQDPTPPKGERGPRKEFRQGDKPMVSPEKRAEKMAQELSLNAAEKAKVQALFEKQDAKHKEQMEKGEKMKAEMKVKFDAERKANDEEMTKIIGPEKFKKLQDMRVERMEKMKNRREKHGDHHPENPPAPAN
jgi:Spy/CpxP family protein refolding chaperone